MSKTAQLGLGMGGPTILMHDGDACSNIKGYAIQAMEECVFSVFDLDWTPVHATEQSQVITAVTHGDEEFTVADVTKFAVGDRVLIRLNGGTAPTANTATEMPQNDQVYYIQAIDTASNEFKLEEFKGAGAIAISDDGSGFEGVATVAKLVNQNDRSHGDFTITSGSKLDVTNRVSGNPDMFDTDGAEDVKIPKGMTIYLPVTAITITTGACIVYTK
tara:strand:+ start:171 stop:821 length:651 start_codon:yes stop_codon:yes gene_type:complete